MRKGKEKLIALNLEKGYRSGHETVFRMKQMTFNLLNM